MLKNRNTKKKLIFGLAGLLGLCSALSLIFALKNIGNDPVNQPKKFWGDTIPSASSNDDNPSVKQGPDQSYNSLDQAEEVVGVIDNTGSEQCSARCDSTLSMLDQDIELDDEAFNKLATYAEEIAAYLQNNQKQRQHYLQMAMTTTDGDKRSFLTDVFKYLPYEQKAEIGDYFIRSENWRVRADGVTLIADHDISNLDVANGLMDILSNEENSYVKGTILAYLKHSPTLQGDIEVLHQLDLGLYNQENTSVRVAALKAKMQLSEQSYHILPDALQALRTSEPELQLAGLIAISQILEHEQKYIESGYYIDRNSIKNDIQIIRDLAVYDGDDKRFGRLIREANIIYLRYFD
jgi:hypothetical protein